MPLISIIIPTYNSEKTISESIKSILEQSFDDYEVLVMDGVSGDNTLNIVKEFNDPRIKIFSEKDSGVYDAMNKGIEKAEGKWLYFLGSDDTLFSPNTLLNVTHHINENNEEIDFYYGCIYSEKYGEKYDGVFTREKILSKNIGHQAIFFNKNIFSKLGTYNLKYKILADYDFNLRAILNKNIRTKYIDEIIANYNTGGLSDRIIDIDFRNDKTKIILEHGFKTLPLKKLKNFTNKKGYCILLIKRALL